MQDLLKIEYKDWFINQKRTPDKESAEYKEFYNFHKRLCTEGCMIGDTFFNPFLMWHLNFWHTSISEQDEKGRIYEVYGNPSLRDNEWMVTNEIHKAEQEHKGLVIFGIRRFSKSTLESSYIAWGATFDENSQNIIAGLNGPDIKVLTDMIDKGLTRVPEAWRWQRIEDNWKNQVTLGIKTKDGMRIPFSSILIRNLDDGNNQEAIAGTKPRKLIIDEGGKGNFLKALQAAIPGFTTPYGWGCSPIVTGTGGDMKKFMDAKSLFFDTDQYNFMTYNNAADAKTTHGLFISNKYRLEAKEQSTMADYLQIEDKSLKGVPIMVSNEEKANKILEENLVKLKRAGDRNAYLKEKMYYPKEVDDIFLNEDTNIFNILSAQRQAARLRDDNIQGSNVFLEHDGEKIIHKFTNKMPITNYPHKPNDDTDAPIVIYEMPIKNPPFGLYVAGCLTPGEKVMTDSGLKKVEEINYNDRLINENGEIVDINALLRYDKVNEDVYTVKMSNTVRTTTFTQEHPLLVSPHITTSNGGLDEKLLKFEYKEIKDIKENSWIKVPNIYKSKNEFDLALLWNSDKYRIDRTIDNPLYKSDFWWFIGLFLGDGWCNKKGYKISVSFNVKETNHITRFTNIIKDLFQRPVHSRVRGNCIECSFTFQELSSFLTFHFGKFAGGKNIPEWAKRISTDCKKQLVLGYLDSDGCIHKDNRGYYGLDFVSISLDLLEGIQDILLSLGYISGMSILRKKSVHTFPNGKESETKETYHLRVGHNATIRFIKTLGNTTSHKILSVDLKSIKKTVKSPKKGCFLSEDLNYIYFRIKKITKSSYTGLVYNFDCVTHTFMCHHITTHNCDPYRQANSKMSSSLGAVYILKRMHDIQSEKFQDMIVASYVSRPENKDKWNEQARMLIKYYNARTLVENDEMSFIEYMKNKGDAQYLERQPPWLKEIVPNTTVNRDYGIHRSSQKVIDYMHNCLKEYLDEVIYSEKDEKGSEIKEVLGVARIRDRMLLEEIIQFTDDGNFDRIVSVELAIALANHLDNIIKVGGTESDSRIKELYNKAKKMGGSLFGTSDNLFKERKSKLWL